MQMSIVVHLHKSALPVQAVAALHEVGMAHGSIRQEKILVLLNSDNTVESCTLLDLGDSAPCHGMYLATDGFCIIP